MSRTARAILAVGVFATLALGPVPAMARPAQQHLDPALCSPEENTFTLAIDNPYFPLPVGQHRVFLGPDDEVGTLGLQITVLDETENLYRGRDTVVTRVVRELEWADADADGVVDAGEDLIEVSHNYFAQVDSGAQPGTVCYFGEVVAIYEDGEVVSDDGSWRADAKGNVPGIFMPAAPQKGQHFQTEGAEGVAEDEATIVGVRTVSVPAGRFKKAIEVLDCNPLDGDCGIKYYAPGWGLIADNDVLLQAG